MSKPFDRARHDGGGFVADHTEPGPRRRMRGEKGYVLAVTGLLLLPLLVFTAFAVDLGSWYAQGARMQRAVDAASLAGVVQLPNQTNAKTTADAVMKDNGYDMAVYCPANNCYSYPSGAGQQMTITLKASASQYFSQIVLKGQTLSRSATAVYNLRIPLGSPANAFGNDPVSGLTPNVWAAINGPYSNHADGDAYSVKCAVGSASGSSTSCDGSGSNIPPTYGGTNGQGTYRPTGYTWVVDVPQALVGSTITVSVYDPAFGPNGAVAEGTSGANGVGFATSYQLFNTKGASADLDLTPGNGMNSAPGLGLCTGGTLGYKVFTPGTTSGATPAPNTQYTSAWYPLCTFVASAAGQYPIQVKSSAIPGVTDQGGGYNAYSLQAVKSGGGAQPSLYAVQDLSIWTPTPGTAKFYLANIGQQYAGHTLVVDMYDPGDGGSGNYFLQVLQPPGGTPNNPPTGGVAIPCNYSLPSTLLGGAATNQASSPNCSVQTRVNGAGTPNVYNNKWLRISIDIPVGYTCSTDCWWTVNYLFNNVTAGSPPTDRTVWVVNVLGDPVHLTK